MGTLCELARNSVEQYASRIAFSMFGGEEVTYAEAGRRMQRVQELLTGAGLEPGDKVVLLSSSMPNWGIGYFAVVSAGMVVARRRAFEPGAQCKMVSRKLHADAQRKPD